MHKYGSRFRGGCVRAEFKDCAKEPGDKEVVVTVETVAGENPQTVHLYPLIRYPILPKSEELLFLHGLPLRLNKLSKSIGAAYGFKGNTFTVSGTYAENRKDGYIISIVPELTDYSLPEHKLVPQGTWMLYRNLETGAPSLIKIYPRENPALSVSLRPAPQKAYSGKSFIDICLFNVYVRKDIAIGVPFETLYTISLSQLKELTQAIIPWDLFNPPRYDSTVKVMAQRVENLRYRLVPLKDGCFDHNGKPVHISNSQPQTELEITSAMNIDQLRSEVIGGVDSAGFAKWIIDGLVRPVAGQGLLLNL